MAVLKLLFIVLSFLEELVLCLPRPLRAYYLSLKFLIRLAFDVYSGSSETRTTLPSSPPVPAKVFRPDGSNGRLLPTYVVIHGLTVSGFNDNRILQLAKALCVTGAIVVVPQFDGLSACEISRERVVEIESVAEAIAADAHLCPSGGVSTVSACITAGFMLVATTRTGVIKSTLCIGTHASARHILSHSLATNGQGDVAYAVEAILLSSYARGDPELQTLFHTSLADDHLRLKGTEQEGLPDMMRCFPRAARTYDDVMGKFEDTRKVLQKVYEDDQSLWEAVSPLLCVRDIGCRSVTLMHAANDCIIPPLESRLLFEALRKENPKVKSSMKITSLLDHGDKQQFDISVVPELVVLSKSLSHFFRYSTE